jgi:hypothetical protein
MAFAARLSAGGCGARELSSPVLATIGSASMATPARLSTTRTQPWRSAVRFTARPSSAMMPLAPTPQAGGERAKTSIYSTSREEESHPIGTIFRRDRRHLLTVVSTTHTPGPSTLPLLPYPAWKGNDLSVTFWRRVTLGPAQLSVP